MVRYYHLTFTRTELLISRLERAFPDILFEGSDPCCNAFWGDTTAEELLFCRTWSQFTDKELHRTRWEGTYPLSDEAFNYLLPAYLLKSLSDNEPDDHIASRYLPIDDFDPSKRNMDLLTDEQREVVCDWLAWWLDVADQEWQEYLADSETIRRADYLIIKEDAERQQLACRLCLLGLRVNA